jgi:hypothetical protein
METQSTQGSQQKTQQEYPQLSGIMTAVSCVAGIIIPGLGHALLKKWTRALVFFLSISIMVMIGLQLHGRVFDPEFGDIFSILKFFAEAGAGLFYWIPWFGGTFKGDPTAYTYDYANLFLYVAGLLNMLIVIDVFDISMGRKQ